MARTAHLARRFFGSLSLRGPGVDAELWVSEQLLPGERALWARMSRADRRHAHAVARRVERSLGHEATRPVVAAALLHDVGKTDSGLGNLRPGGRDVVGCHRRSRDGPRVADEDRHHPQGRASTCCTRSSAVTSWRWRVRIR